MFDRLTKMFSWNRVGNESAEALPKAVFLNPYRDYKTNFMYNLLFCDNLSLFDNAETKSAYPELFSEEPDIASLKLFANDEKRESRFRILGFNRLRSLNVKIPPRILLGVIIEMPMEKGLDTLAVYRDNSIRYLNQTGKIGIVERSALPFEQKIYDLFNASQQIVDKIGPWHKSRLEAPTGNTARMSFLTSGGLCFGQGPIDVLFKEAKAGPVLKLSSEILVMTTDLLVKSGRSIS